MALPEKRDELNREDRVEDRYKMGSGEREMQREEPRHKGHDFAMDVHPERYPRQSLSRLEEGILDDDHKRHSHDHLGDAIPDFEHRIDDARNRSRTLMVSGSMLLIFAWILAWWVGWDARSGNRFFSTMWSVGVIIGLGLIVWGSVERRRLIRVLRRMPLPTEGGRERIGNERERSEGDRAA